MAFFDELKKNLSGVSGTVAKTSETVVKKSGNVLEIQKAKLKKVSLESELKDIYAQLGQLYFENYAAGDMPKEMAALCEKVTACQHAINEAEQRAALLKGVVICSHCQAEVDKEASYCPKCGAEIVHVVEDAETETVEASAEADSEEPVDKTGEAEAAEENTVDSAAESGDTEGEIKETIDQEYAETVETQKDEDSESNTSAGRE